MKTLIFSGMIVLLSLASFSSSAVTLVEGSQVGGSNATSNTNERAARGKLTARYAEGKIVTSLGTFSTKSAEVIDHRPIDDWYKTPTNAEVALYFKDDRLTRVVIY